MSANNGLIFDENRVADSTLRIAYQIYEANFDRKRLYLVGIASNGLVYAERIKSCLERISSLEVILVELQVDKKNPHAQVRSSIALEELKDQSVVVVDDVLNTGSTLMYAVKYLLGVPLAQLNTAVLVNRNHKKYPVKADFKGVSLSTSVNEHIEVRFDGDSAGVYLT